MPLFPNGIEELKKHIKKNIKYPKTDKQGTVYLRFEVKKDGTIGKIELQKGISDLLDKEAVRVVSTLPSFKPGEQNGRKVNVWYSIPITFKKE